MTAGNDSCFLRCMVRNRHILQVAFTGSVACFPMLLSEMVLKLEMWANAQRDGRPADYSWRPLFNAAKFG